MVLLLSTILSVTAQETDCLYYFYGDGCPQCIQAEKYIQTLSAKYPSLEIHRYETYYNKENAKLLQDYYNSFGVPQKEQGVPAVFLPGSYFLGSKSISNLLEGAILENSRIGCPSLSSASVGIIGESSPRYLVETLTFPVLSTAAFNGLFAKGALTLLLLLLVIAIGIPDYGKLLRERELTLKKGLVFISGIALPYLLFGFGLLGWLASSKVTAIFAVMASILALLFAGHHLYGFLKRKKRLSYDEEKIQQQKENKLNRWLFSQGSIFAESVVFSALSLGSAGSFMVLLRHLFEDSFTRAAVTPLILFYALMFVLPFFAVFIILFFLQQRLIHHGHKKDIYSDIDKWKKHHLKLLNVVLSAAMIVLSIVVLWM